MHYILHFTPLGFAFANMAKIKSCEHFRVYSIAYTVSFSFFNVEVYVRVRQLHEFKFQAMPVFARHKQISVSFGLEHGTVVLVYALPTNMNVN
jgi:hypothetical protein